MNPHDFFDLIIRFAAQPIPATLNRHTYVWVGDTEALISNSPIGFIQYLNLHDLCKDLVRTPLGDKAAARVLSDTIDSWIKANYLPKREQRALLVSGLDLLYRYRIPIGAFMRLASESSMVIFTMSAKDLEFSPIHLFPGFIKFSPQEILRHLTSAIPEEAIVKAE